MDIERYNKLKSEKYILEEEIRALEIQIKKEWSVGTRVRHKNERFGVGTVTAIKKGTIWVTWDVSGIECAMADGSCFPINSMDD